MIDYVLTAAVGISAGVGALVSAVPRLQPHTLAICLGILAVITMVNLRGLREAGIFFMAPTYLFLGTLLITIGVGLFKTVLASGHPAPVVSLPQAPITPAVATASAWILLQAFSNGCTAMTGVEAVSNGVKAFREPTVKNAQRTLTTVIGLLMVLLAGIAYLTRAYHIMATDPGQPGYRSVLSMLVAAVTGTGAFYYVTMASILLILSLSANTAFADFPRLCRAVALNGYLPNSFTVRGRRLVYNQGIYMLALVTAGLLILFGGVTDRLIPLFAIGAFLAFTLSQAGMVAHWRKKRGRGWLHSMLINGFGALATGITLLVVLVAKFVSGAWITVLLIPILLITMSRVKRHYNRVADEIKSASPFVLAQPVPPIVVVPVQSWSKLSEKALQFALNLSPDIHALHIAEETDNLDDIRRKWNDCVDIPAKKMGLAPPELAIVQSPYRQILTPIVDYVREMEAQHPGRQIAVLVPEMVEHHWYHNLLHNKRAELLKALLLVKGSDRIVIINIPWYLQA